MSGASLPHHRDARPRRPSPRPPGARPPRGPGASHPASSGDPRRSGCSPSLAPQQTVGERFRAERPEIVRALADADEPDGHARAPPHAEDDAALRGAIHLRQDDPRQLHRVGERARLRDRRSDRSSRRAPAASRRPRPRPSRSPASPSRARPSAASSCGAARRCRRSTRRSRAPSPTSPRRTRPLRDRRPAAATTMCAPDALRPHLELLARRGAERVARREAHRVSLRPRGTWRASRSWWSCPIR